MSIARHHAGWLSLLDISGPFLSMPVLLRVFPQGLDKDDPDHRRELRLAYGKWLDNRFGLQADPAIHRAWQCYVLEQTLQLPQEVLAEGQAIPPDLRPYARSAQQAVAGRAGFWWARGGGSRWPGWATSKLCLRPRQGLAM